MLFYQRFDSIKLYMFFQHLASPAGPSFFPWMKKGSKKIKPCEKLANPNGMPLAKFPFRANPPAGGPNSPTCAPCLNWHWLGAQTVEFF
jgi:hypothetical protein